MRRKEMESRDIAVFEELSTKMEVGYLGINVADGFPRVIPVNFIAIDRDIYFHGAGEGEKFDAIKSSPPVTFSIDKALSVIPSYWLSKKNAGGATQFYKSVLIKGHARIVEDYPQKCHILQLLMEKYQPEGNYLKVTPKETLYNKIVERTVIIKVESETIDIKVKLPSGKPDEYKQKLVRHLRERGAPRDLETASAIEKHISQSD